MGFKLEWALPASGFAPGFKNGESSSLAKSSCSRLRECDSLGGWLQRGWKPLAE